MRILHGGPILSMDPACPHPEAVGVREGRIVSVGSLAAARQALPGAAELDLAGRCLLPGFVDAHHHFSEGALLTTQLNLHPPAVASVSDILDAVRARAREVPAGGWVVGEGYDERRLAEGRPPTLAELDRVCPEHPVVLIQFSYHELVTNSAAHRRLGLPLERPHPPGGKIERGRDGRPTGRMIENACAPFYNGAVEALLAGDPGFYRRCLQTYQQRLFRAGLTRVFDPAVPPRMERQLRQAKEAGSLRMPVLVMPSSTHGMFHPPRDRLQDPPTGTGDGLLRIGPLKLFMDGGVRCAMRLPLGVVLRSSLVTLGRLLRARSLRPLRAARLVPVDVDLRRWEVRSGILFYERAEAAALVRAAVERGFSVAVHAEGNEAIDRTLDVLPRPAPERPPGVAPHRIEHFFLPGPDAIGRARDLGLAVAVQPVIVEHTGDQVLDMGLIGRHSFNPFRSMLAAGIPVAGSSDAPVVDFDPLHGIRAAVERRTAGGEPLGDGEEIGVEDALRLYTVHAARSGGLEHECGSITPGKRADLVVLSENPLSLRPGELHRLRVLRTIVGGEEVWTSDGRES